MASQQAPGGGRGTSPAASAAGSGQVEVAGEAGAARHLGQAARRAGQSVRPRQVHLRHQSPRDALRPDRPLAAAACAGGIDRPHRSAEGAGREDRDRLEGNRHRVHVPGRGGRRHRRRHGRARLRCRSTGARPLRGAAPSGQRGTGDGAQRAGRVHGRQHETGSGPGDRRSRRRLQAGGAHRRADLCDPRHHPRLPGNARHGVRVGGRQADGMGVDAGGARQPRQLRDGARHSASQRPGDHAVHGRRLRQQVHALCRRHHLRPAGQGRRRSGQADARPERGASRQREPSVGDRAHSCRRVGRRHAHGVRRAKLGHGRCRRDVELPVAVHLCVPEPQADAHRTSTSTPASSARCALRAIHRDASSPKS